MKYFITIDFSPFYIQLHIEDMLCICKRTIKCDNIENTQNTQMEKYLHFIRTRNIDLTCRK